MANTITSKQNPLIKQLRLLTQKKGDFSATHFLVEGDHLVEEARRAGLIDKTLVDIRRAITEPEADILISEAIGTMLSQQKSWPGILGLCRRPTVTSWTGHRLVYLDGLQDPGNVGTILRTAKAFDISAVLYQETTADPWGFKTLQSSQGASFLLPVIKMNRAELKALKSQGYTLVGTTLQSPSTPLPSWKVPEKCVLILGHEGQGLHPETLALLDERITIPMSGMESLNVAVAFGIFAYFIHA